MTGDWRVTTRRHLCSSALPIPQGVAWDSTRASALQSWRQDKGLVYYTLFIYLAAIYMETERNGGYIHLLSVSFLVETTQNLDY